MTLQLALTILIPAAIGTGVLAITVADLVAVHEKASGRAAEVQAMNDAQMLEAARLMHEMQTGKRNATEEELVAAGLLKPSWLTRERVDTTPIELPTEGE